VPPRLLIVVDDANAVHVPSGPFLLEEEEYSALPH